MQVQVHTLTPSAWSPWGLAGPCPPTALSLRFQQPGPCRSQSGCVVSQFCLLTLLGDSFLRSSRVLEFMSTDEHIVSFPGDDVRSLTPGCGVPHLCCSVTSIPASGRLQGQPSPRLLEATGAGPPRPSSGLGTGLSCCSHWLPPRLMWRRPSWGWVTSACDRARAQWALPVLA